jgi:SAM-dependent methyltransferase
MDRLEELLKKIIKPKGNAEILRRIPKNGIVLDVGCGNNSPARFKHSRPDIHYIGLDVGEYNQAVAPETIADSYIVTSPEGFAGEIEKLEGSVDAVISHHNLEHCICPEGVLSAMLKSLKKGGQIFLTFPCEESVSFPRRRGTLNFYDDTTHSAVPDYHAVCKTIREHEFNIDFAVKRYRPALLFVIGLVTEPINAVRGTRNSGTWALYGFESIIWASRPNNS